MCCLKLHYYATQTDACTHTCTPGARRWRVLRKRMVQAVALRRVLVVAGRVLHGWQQAAGYRRGLKEKAVALMLRTRKTVGHTAQHGGRHYQKTRGLVFALNKYVLLQVVVNSDLPS